MRFLLTLILAVVSLFAQKKTVFLITDAEVVDSQNTRFKGKDLLEAWQR